MRTMAEMATGLAAAITGWRVRMALVLVGFFVGAATAHAQDVSVEFAEGTLAPAAEEMAAAGVDGSLESAATLIEIAQRYGFGYGISPDEVRDLLARAAGRKRELAVRSALEPCALGDFVALRRRCRPDRLGAAGRRGARLWRTGHRNSL